MPSIVATSNCVAGPSPLEHVVPLQDRQEIKIVASGAGFVLS
jgi:hypothetical protein